MQGLTVFCQRALDDTTVVMHGYRINHYYNIYPYNFTSAFKGNWRAPGHLSGRSVPICFSPWDSHYGSLNKIQKFKKCLPTWLRIPTFALQEALREAQVNSAFITAGLRCGDKNCVTTVKAGICPLGQCVHLRFEEELIQRQQNVNYSFSVRCLRQQFFLEEAYEQCNLCTLHYRGN